LHIPVYFFLLVYNLGAFTELQQSLTEFLDSYSRWKESVAQTADFVLPKIQRDFSTRRIDSIKVTGFYQ